MLTALPHSTLHTSFQTLLFQVFVRVCSDFRTCHFITISTAEDSRWRTGQLETLEIFFAKDLFRNQTSILKCMLPAGPRERDCGALLPQPGRGEVPGTDVSGQM